MKSNYMFLLKSIDVDLRQNCPSCIYILFNKCWSLVSLTSKVQTRIFLRLIGRYLKQIFDPSPMFNEGLL